MLLVRHNRSRIYLGLVVAFVVLARAAEAQNDTTTPGEVSRFMILH